MTDFELAVTIGKNLKNARGEHGYTLRDVANICGYTDAYISQVEHGCSGNMSIRMIARLATLYSMTMSDLTKAIV